MLRLRVVVLGMALGCGAVGAARAEAPAADPKAVAVAEKVMASLGGQAAWDATHYLRFDFAYEEGGKELMRRAHTWDKYTGRYRLEAKGKDGKPYLVLMNINTKEGQAWLDGKPLAGEELKKYLQRGYEIWINDTYWLIMPYKLRDPGVNLAYAGEEKAGADAWDKLLLTFNNVGVTPKDKYWVWVNRSTGLVDRWDYVLEDKTEGPGSWLWKGWTKQGQIQLAPDRFGDPKKKERIWFPVMQVPATVGDEVFSRP